MKRKRTKPKGNPIHIILTPLVEQLMKTTSEGTKLAQLTGYKQGPDIVRMCADTMAEINVLVRKKENR